MDGRYGGAAYEPYSGTAAYGGNAATTTSSRRRNGPCYEEYDPNSGSAVSNGAHHQLLRPVAGLGLDLEPIPLSKEVQRRHHCVNFPQTTAALSPGASFLSAQASTMEQKLMQGSFIAIETLQRKKPPQPQSVASSSEQRIVKMRAARKVQQHPPWLATLSIQVSGLSLEPLSGVDIMDRLQSKTSDVTLRYLPCVDFLVACQQELRAGLAAQKRGVYASYQVSHQFYKRFVAPLPNRFRQKNACKIPEPHLTKAYQELVELTNNAASVQRQGPESIKNTFLGGMKDGESWGLRKWLSKNGGALSTCNELEQVLHACQKLDRNLDTTRQLASLLRPLAQSALNRLKSEVPPSYQEVSTAHPYLPFFHRLESALRGMANFDPDDDDVICLDDDDDDDDEPPPPPKRKAPPPAKRKASPAPKRPRMEQTQAFVLDDSDGDDSVIEILEVKPAAASLEEADASDDGLVTCNRCSMPLSSDSDACFMCGTQNFAELTHDLDEYLETKLSPGRTSAESLADGLETLATLFDTNAQASVRPQHVVNPSFWDGDRYAGALRLFATILRAPEASHYINPIDEQELMDQGLPCYSQVIRHPICFRDIVEALLMDDSEQVSSGQLANPGLGYWNMWRGLELFQAIDLVFLNALAYGKASLEGRSSLRSQTNKLRKQLWAGIQQLLQERIPNPSDRKPWTPTRRGESSGFVIQKKR